MARDIFSLRNKNKKPLLSATVKRIVLADLIMFFLLFVISNVFTIVITNNILINNLDNRLKNEVLTLLDSFKIQQDSIIFVGYSEIKEPDFTTVNYGAFFLQVYNNKNKLLLKSANLDLFGQIPFNIPQTNSNYEFDNITIGNHKLRVVYTPLLDEHNRTAAYMQLSVFRTEYSSIMQKIILFNLFNLPFILLIILLVSIFLAKKSYAPINKIISIAQHISALNLRERIKYDAHPQDELGRLRDTLNNLFSRLEVQFNQISQFTDNASHQLMTPLTALKTELEYILKKDRAPQEYKDTLVVLNAQTDKMIKITKSLLILAKFSGNPELNKDVFNVSHVVDDIIKQSFNNNNIESKISKNIYLRGSYEGFEIIMQNLIDNAIKYSADNGLVTVEAVKVDDKIIMSVSDSGVGIPNEDKEKIFDRFYRTPSTLKSEIKGYGLGLSLVKEIVLSMQGIIQVKDNTPSGTVFIITFPSIDIK